MKSTIRWGLLQRSTASLKSNKWKERGKCLHTGIEIDPKSKISGANGNEPLKCGIQFVDNILLTSSNNQIYEFRIPNTYN